MESKINLGTTGASSLSLAAGLFHLNSISSIKKEVEALKSSIQTNDNENTEENTTTIDLFGDTEEELLPEIEEEEESNSSVETPLETPIEQLGDAVKQAEADMKKVSNVPGGITGIMKKVSAGEKKAASVDNRILDTVGDLKPLVDISGDLKEIEGEYDMFSSRAQVSGDGVFRGQDCNIVLMGNRGDDSALHFAGLSDNKWVMYMANPSGKGPSANNSMGEESPPSHAQVTGNAIRMRVGGGKGEGFMVETPDGRGVFSVGSDGRMSSGPATFGDVDAETAGFAHVGKLSPSDFSVSQHRDGTTRANSATDQDLKLCVGGNPKIWVDSSGSLVVKNLPGVSNTVFNKEGENIIVCKSGSTTDFRIGNNNTPILQTGVDTVISKDLVVNGTNLINEINGIRARLSAMDDQPLNDIGGQEEDAPPVFISTPQAYPSIPVVIQRGDAVSFENVASERYLHTDNDNNLMLHSSQYGDDVKFRVETMDYSLYLENNVKIALKSLEDHGNYVKWASNTSITVKGTSDQNIESHFLIRSNSKRIRSGDIVTLYSYSGGGLLKTTGSGTNRSLAISGNVPNQTLQYIITKR